MARKTTRAPAKPSLARKALTKGPSAVAKADTLAAAGKLKPWSKVQIEEAFRRWRAANPHPKGELEHINPFTLVVAVALSAQATDVGVNKATRNIFPTVDTPEKMLAFGEDRLRDAIKSIGFFNVKAKNVIALAKKLVAEHGGQVPRVREALEALPGVGRKTAIVGNRTGLAPGKTPLDVELRLNKVVPEEYQTHAHHWLILHGRYICKAVRPLCEQCLINDLCRWPGKVTFLAGAKATKSRPKNPPGVVVRR